MRGTGIGLAVPAAGSGRRMGGRKKAFLELLGEPVLLHALRPFLDHPDLVSVCVALPADEAEEPPAWLAALDPRIRIVAGGRTRGDSVRAALEAVDPAAEVVLVHDAARPLVTRAIIDRCVAVARRGEGAVAGWPSTDTLKEVERDGNAGGRIVATLDRSRIWRAQTPQAFPRSRLLEAYRAAGAGDGATDDAAVFQSHGGRVRIVEGEAWNLKVTHPEDASVAEALLARRQGADLA